MKKIIVIIIVIIVVVGAGWFIYNDINKDKNPTDNTLVEDIVATSTDDTPSDIEDDLPISDDVTRIDTNAPNLDRPIVFYNEALPEDAKTLLVEKIERSRNLLKDDSDIFSEWLALGVNYKIIGDLEGARDAWEYASIIRPQNTTSFTNLGDLYHFFLKDFKKAEENLRTAVINDPNKANAYIMLHELYKYSYKQDTTLVTDILFEGLNENPNNIDLLITLAAYYKETGNTINAIKYYEQARDEAQKLGNAQLVDLLNQELSNL